MSRAARPTIVGLVAAAGSAPLWIRSASQGLGRGGLTTLAAAALLAAIVAAIAPIGPVRRGAVSLVAAGALAGIGTVATRASLAAFGAATLLSVLTVALAPRRSRGEIAAALPGVSGFSIGCVALLTGDRALLPAAVVLAGVVASSVLDVAVAGREPGDPIERPIVGRVVSAAPSGAVGALVGSALWVAGRHGQAVVVWLLVAVITAATVSSVTAAAGVARVSDAIGGAVGRVLTVVCLAPVYVFVVVPLGLVRRAFGMRRLDLSWRSITDSYWLVPDPSRTRRPARDMFSDERAWGPAHRRDGGSHATVIRTVVAVLAVQAVVGGVVWAWRERTEPRREFVGASDFGSGRAASLAGYPWRDEALRETGEAGSGLVATPYTGWSLRDYEGRYVNVQDRVRRSYEPDLPAGGKPLDIWFFGGSSMFGFDLQRDEHTIPSEFARLAERDGIPVRVRNYGAPAYVNYQETVLLSLLLSAGERPDLVVFYDGVNDWSLGLLDAFAGFSRPGEPADHYAQVMRTAFADSDLVPGMTDEPPAPLTSPRRGVTSVPTLARDIVRVYGQGVDLARALGEHYDIPIAQFWQPDAFSKSELVAGERSRLDDLGFASRSIRGMQRLSRAVRDRLPDGVVDIGDALDGLDGPVLTDTVHVNEEGGRAVAVAMYDELRDRLRSLDSDR